MWSKVLFLLYVFIGINGVLSVAQGGQSDLWTNRSPPAPFCSPGVQSSLSQSDSPYWRWTDSTPRLGSNSSLPASDYSYSGLALINDFQLDADIFDYNSEIPNYNYTIYLSSLEVYIAGYDSKVKNPYIRVYSDASRRYSMTYNITEKRLGGHYYYTNTLQAEASLYTQFLIEWNGVALVYGITPLLRTDLNRTLNVVNNTNLAYYMGFGFTPVQSHCKNTYCPAGKYYSFNTATSSYQCIDCYTGYYNTHPGVNAACAAKCGLTIPYDYSNSELGYSFQYGSLFLESLNSAIIGSLSSEYQVAYPLANSSISNDSIFILKDYPFLRDGQLHAISISMYRYSNVAYSYDKFNFFILDKVGANSFKVAKKKFNWQTGSPGPTGLYQVIIPSQSDNFYVSKGQYLAVQCTNDPTEFTLNTLGFGSLHYLADSLAVGDSSSFASYSGASLGVSYTLNNMPAELYGSTSLPSCANPSSYVCYNPSDSSVCDYGVGACSYANTSGLDLTPQYVPVCSCSQGHFLQLVDATYNRYSCSSSCTDNSWETESSHPLSNPFSGRELLDLAEASYANIDNTVISRLIHSDLLSEGDSYIQRVSVLYSKLDRKNMNIVLKVFNAVDAAPTSFKFVASYTLTPTTASDSMQQTYAVYPRNMISYLSSRYYGISVLGNSILQSTNSSYSKDGNSTYDVYYATRDYSNPSSSTVIAAKEVFNIATWSFESLRANQADQAACDAGMCGIGQYFDNSGCLKCDSSSYSQYPNYDSSCSSCSNIFSSYTITSYPDSSNPSDSVAFLAPSENISNENTIYINTQEVVTVRGVLHRFDLLAFHPSGVDSCSLAIYIFDSNFRVRNFSFVSGNLYYNWGWNPVTVSGGLPVYPGDLIGLSISQCQMHLRSVGSAAQLDLASNYVDYRGGKSNFTTIPRRSISATYYVEAPAALIFINNGCASYNPCSSAQNPCENNGQCVYDGAANYHCICPVGYFGQNCGGSCAATGNSYGSVSSSHSDASTNTFTDQLIIPVTDFISIAPRGFITSISVHYAYLDPQAASSVTVQVLQGIGLSDNYNYRVIQSIPLSNSQAVKAGSLYTYQFRYGDFALNAGEVLGYYINNRTAVQFRQSVTSPYRLSSIHGSSGKVRVNQYIPSSQLTTASSLSDDPLIDAHYPAIAFSWSTAESQCNATACHVNQFYNTTSNKCQTCSGTGFYRLTPGWRTVCDEAGLNNECFRLPDSSIISGNQDQEEVFDISGNHVPAAAVNTTVINVLDGRVPVTGNLNQISLPMWVNSTLFQINSNICNLIVAVYRADSNQANTFVLKGSTPAIFYDPSGTGSFTAFTTDINVEAGDYIALLSSDDFCLPAQTSYGQMYSLSVASPELGLPASSTFQLITGYSYSIQLSIVDVAYNLYPQYCPAVDFLTSPCSPGNNPCQNGAVCTNLTQSQSYRCDCIENYRGKNCESKCDSLQFSIQTYGSTSSSGEASTVPPGTYFATENAGAQVYDSQIFGPGYAGKAYVTSISINYEDYFIEDSRVEAYAVDAEDYDRLVDAVFSLTNDTTFPHAQLALNQNASLFNYNLFPVNQLTLQQSANEVLGFVIGNQDNLPAITNVQTQLFDTNQNVLITTMTGFPFQGDYIGTLSYSTYYEHAPSISYSAIIDMPDTCINSYCDRNQYYHSSLGCSQCSYGSYNPNPSFALACSQCISPLTDTYGSLAFVPQDPNNCNFPSYLDVYDGTYDAGQVVAFNLDNRIGMNGTLNSVSVGVFNLGSFYQNTASYCAPLLRRRLLGTPQSPSAYPPPPPQIEAEDLSYQPCEIIVHLMRLNNASFTEISSNSEINATTIKSSKPFFYSPPRDKDSGWFFGAAELALNWLVYPDDYIAVQIAPNCGLYKRAYGTVFYTDPAAFIPGKGQQNVYTKLTHTSYSIQWSISAFANSFYPQQCPGLCDNSTQHQICAGIFDRCVDLTNDAQHCGDCENLCQTPGHSFATCTNSLCSYTCNFGYSTCHSIDGVDCNVRQSQYLTDSNNCGVCGNQCSSDLICLDGSCVAASTTLPQPAIRSLSPRVLNSTGALVTIIGTNLGSIASLTVNSIALLPIAQSASLLTFQAPSMSQEKYLNAYADLSFSLVDDSQLNCNPYSTTRLSSNCPDSTQYLYYAKLVILGKMCATNNSADCQTCPAQGAKCPGGNIIESLPGYYVPCTCPVVFSCNDDGEDRCGGGAAGLSNSAQCATGYIGSLCNQCADGYVKQNQVCIDCGTTGETQLLIIMLLTLVYFLIVGLCIVLFSDTFLDRLAILIVLLQQLVVVGESIYTRFPPLARTVWNYMRIIRLDYSFFRPNCNIDILSVIDRFFISFAVLGLLLVFFSICALLHQYLKQPERKNYNWLFSPLAPRLGRAVLFTVYTTYIQSTIMILQIINCQQYPVFEYTEPSISPQRMQSDNKQICYQNPHSGASAIAWFGLYFYCAGLPAYFLYKVWSNKRKGRLEDKIFLQNWGFLVRDMRPKYFFVRSLNWVYAFITAVQLALLPTRIDVQIPIMAGIAFAEFIIVTLFKPFDQHWKHIFPTTAACTRLIFAGILLLIVKQTVAGAVLIVFFTLAAILLISYYFNQHTKDKLKIFDEHLELASQRNKKNKQLAKDNSAAPVNRDITIDPAENATFKASSEENAANKNFSQKNVNANTSSDIPILVSEVPSDLNDL
jgi:hypothetical protein